MHNFLQNFQYYSGRVIYSENTLFIDGDNNSFNRYAPENFWVFPLLAAQLIRSDRKLAAVVILDMLSIDKVVLQT